jgi:hypothetical protein
MKCKRARATTGTGLGIAADEGWVPRHEVWKGLPGSGGNGGPSLMYEMLHAILEIHVQTEKVVMSSDDISTGHPEKRSPAKRVTRAGATTPAVDPPCLTDCVPSTIADR